MSAGPRDRLGKGLGALLNDYMEGDPLAGEGRRLTLEQIAPNPLQPRREFAKEELQDLAASIQVNGLLQPLVVRPAPGGGGAKFQLVAGERRLRAVKSLGWLDIPVVVREVDDETLLVLALVENLQREALGVMEEAQGFQSLRDQFGLTQEQIGKAVGRSRTAVANTLRLLGLPPVVRELLEKGRLSMGHARALLAVADVHRAEALAKMAALNGWSVREVERRVAAADGSSGRAQRSKVAQPALDATLRALREEMREAMGTRVNLRPGKQGRGVVEIPYRDAQDFERVFCLITGREVRDVME